MTADVLSGLEASVEKTRAWVHEVMAELPHASVQEGYHALRAALHVLRDHLPLPEVAHLGAQLPVVVRGLYYEGWRPGAAHDRDLPATLARVGREMGDRTELEPEAVLRAALSVIRRHVSPGEMADVSSALPHRFRALLG